MHEDPVISTKWLVQEPIDIRWLSFDDARIAYHRLSGQTHYLNEVSFDLLSNFLLVPRSLEDVATRLSRGLGEFNFDEVMTDVELLMARFERLGLIDKAELPGP